MLHSNLVSSVADTQVKSTTAAAPAGGSAAGRGGSFGVQAPISCTPVVANSAVDTLCLSFKATVEPELLERLKSLKAEVQESDDDCQFLPFGETTLFSWNLHRTGVKLYPFVLRTGDVSLFLSSRADSSTIPTMQLSIGSLSCQDNLPHLLRSFKMWCVYHKIAIKEEIVSRIDICADLAVSIEKLSLWNQAKMVTRAEKVACYYSNRRLTGVQVGSGDIVLRMYDKIQEMTDKQSYNKRDFFMNIWGENVTDITRVEFQLRRGAIREFFPEKSDFAAVSVELPRIWRYLTADWFRQTSKAVDRLNKHQHRETCSEFWSAVQTAFESFRFTALTRNRKKKHIDMKALLDQAAGIMLTVCAGAGHAAEDTLGILSTAASTIQDRLSTVFLKPSFTGDFMSRVAHATVSF